MSRSLRHVCSVAWLLLLLGCESDFDTRWRRADAQVDASADADAPDMDAWAPPADATTAGDGAVPDGPFVPLPLMIDCSAVMRDAGVECQFNCFAACSLLCSDADSGCGDAAAWRPCTWCSDGGPPTL